MRPSNTNNNNAPPTIRLEDYHSGRELPSSAPAFSGVNQGLVPRSMGAEDYQSHPLAFNNADQFAQSGSDAYMLGHHSTHSRSYSEGSSGREMAQNMYMQSVPSSLYGSPSPSPVDATTWQSDAPNTPQIYSNPSFAHSFDTVTSPHTMSRPYPMHSQNPRFRSVQRISTEMDHHDVPVDYPASASSGYLRPPVSPVTIGLRRTQSEKRSASPGRDIFSMNDYLTGWNESALAVSPTPSPPLSLHSNSSNAPDGLLSPMSAPPQMVSAATPYDFSFPAVQHLDLAQAPNTQIYTGANQSFVDDATFGSAEGFGWQATNPHSAPGSSMLSTSPLPDFDNRDDMMLPMPDEGFTAQSEGPSSAPITPPRLRLMRPKVTTDAMRAASDKKKKHASQWVCHLCTESFTTKYSMTRHIDAHLGIKHPCPECGLQFGNISDRQRHINKKHKTPAPS
ncbi:hypothetical protein PLICRDRAFT_174554 [Plicaturopsis crispa FD-325 SS-3]|nr:hypothetical protein PLICRDRAFT_174554 [Plicaturopsis crispa FD-325 SS-3]